jgi:organic radical activating enzyme
MIPSKTFCILPWIHIHAGPVGAAAPCCISKSASTLDGVGNARTDSLIELVNSKKMNQLRIDMLNGVQNEECRACYNQEKEHIKSFRISSNEDHSKYVPDVLSNTGIDGSIKDFKLRYFDIRFNNICNFKCRTCGQEFSSQWEQENIKNNVSYAQIIPKNKNTKLLSDIIDNIDFIEMAYFAGGEPLITDEHYIILEEMIRKGRTDVHLRYNTNLSTLKFKDKDLIDLWKHFTNRIDVYASIDHYGKRAEYIRHGTNWELVEQNFNLIKTIPYVNLQMNVVYSVFNSLTFYDFWKYLIDNKLYTPRNSIYTIYNMSTPDHLACHILPAEYKLIAKENIQKAIWLMKLNGFGQNKIQQLENTKQWIFAKDSWNEQREKFTSETKRIDSIRAEKFEQVFPELVKLMEM